MRKSVLWNSPHVRFSLAMLLALMIALAMAGCGGGGGGGGGNNNGNGNGNGGGGNPSLATVTGQVTDLAGNAVSGANVSVIGLPSGQSVKTGSDGRFSIFNVPLSGFTQFVVTSPDPTLYFNTVMYLNNQYDTDPSRAGGQCKMPLPTPLHAGANALPGTVQMFSQNSPPPPPQLTCP